MGFGAEKIQPHKLNSWVPYFVELVYLREADNEGQVPASHASIRHLEKKPRLINSVQRALCIHELLTYSTVVVLHEPVGRVGCTAEELVYSSPMSPWGMQLPECHRCGNNHVSAVFGQPGPRKEGNHFVITKCNGCSAITKRVGIRRPSSVVPVSTSCGDGGGCFWKPLHMGTPWIGQSWKIKRDM